MSDQGQGSAVRDPQQILLQLVARQNAGDAAGMAALYEPGAVLDCGNGRLARGRDQIRAFYEEVIATGVKFAVLEQRVALVSEDLALTSTRLPNGNVTAEIARRQKDGAWLWVVDQPAVK
jgi:uncharacterized protein (TIGR02246 family)